VIAVDTNLLVYAHRPEMPRHERARGVLTGLVSQTTLWALPWPCAHEFYAVVTNPWIFQTPAKPAEALAFLEALAANDSLRFISEGTRHLELLGSLAQAADLAGGAIHDARVAAICLGHGITQLWSADRDFSRFPALRVVNPLIVDKP
jgi:uncharacterized protein